MPVPSTVADLSSTASSNYPSGSESIGTSLDDYLRAHASIIKQVSDAKADTSHTQASSSISDSTAAGRTLLTAADAAAQRTALGLTSAATTTVGTSANNLVQLDGSAKLPAVDGSQLTGINAGLSSASTAEAQAGASNTVAITPLRMREGFNASGSAPVYACRAWVNFNGTGTVAIRASGNVSSITDNGTGDYTVNFTTAMPDENYVVNGSGQLDTSTFNSDGIVSIRRGVATPLTTTAASVTSGSANLSMVDFTIVCVSIFR